MNTVTQGSVGLTMAIAYFGRKGFIISLPLNDNQNYDLVVDDGIGLKKVQVKTTGYKHKKADNYVVELKSVRANKKLNNVHGFNGEFVDYLFVLTKEGHQYLIPGGVIRNKNSLSLGKKVEMYQV